MGPTPITRSIRTYRRCENNAFYCLCNSKAPHSIFSATFSFAISATGTLLKTMCQAYSDSPCYIPHEGKLIDIKNWLCLLNYILGQELPCRNGNDVWELYSFFHYAESFADLPPVKAWHHLAKEIENTSLQQLETAFILEMDEPITYEHKSKGIKEDDAGRLYAV